MNWVDNMKSLTEHVGLIPPSNKQTNNNVVGTIFKKSTNMSAWLGGYLFYYCYSG
jgi:hypothetical protein